MKAVSCLGVPSQYGANLASGMIEEGRLSTDSLVFVNGRSFDEVDIIPQTNSYTKLILPKTRSRRHCLGPKATLAKGSAAPDAPIRFISLAYCYAPKLISAHAAFPSEVG